MLHIEKWLGSVKFRYTLMGSLFGAMFPVFAYFLLDHPRALFAIICTAPFFLGLFARVAGAKQENLENQYKETQEDLAEVQEISREIVKESPSAIVCKDYESGQGVFIEWNSAAEKLWGFEREAVVGKTGDQLFPREQADFVQKRDLEILASGELDFSNQKIMGSPANPEMVAEIKTWKVPIKDSNGRHRFLLEISSDVTEEMKAKKRLVRAKELAESGVQSKARFLATMSHEIRTPMNAVLSCANLLLDNVRKPENVALLKTIQNSGDILLTLINDILDFSKIESGKIGLEKTPFNLVENTEETVELFKPKAVEKGVTLSCCVSEEVPLWIEGDATRFKQVLSNLIGNAVKFTRDKVEVVLGGDPCGVGLWELKLSVIDNGRGVPEEAKERLFQDFSQVDASTTRKFGGTGLGLAICRGIVEEMRGKIWVESSIGKGATFSFTVTAKEAKPVFSKEKEELSTADLKMAEEYPLRILMAEDNTVNQMVAKKIIKKLGYEMDIVANGREAVDAVLLKDYDIVFMDQHMPEMDGVEATKEIRRRLNEGPQIVALTASAFKEDKDRCLRSGMDDFLTKPIEMNKVAAVLEKCGVMKKKVA